MALLPFASDHPKSSDPRLATIPDHFRKRNLFFNKLRIIHRWSQAQQLSKDVILNNQRGLSTEIFIDYCQIRARETKLKHHCKTELTFFKKVVYIQNKQSDNMEPYKGNALTTIFVSHYK